MNDQLRGALERYRRWQAWNADMNKEPQDSPYAHREPGAWWITHLATLQQADLHILASEFAARTPGEGGR